MNDPQIGWWGVLDTTTNESKVCGELFSVDGKLICSPERDAEESKILLDEVYEL